MQNSAFYKVWRILYPLIIYFLMDVIIVWAIEALAPAKSAEGFAGFFSANIAAIASVVFLAVSIPVFYSIYKRDYNQPSWWLIKKPGYAALLLIIGALASNGLSSLISVLNLDSIVGNYNEIQNAVFAANPVLVILQTVILAPLSEELLFRGIVFKRLQGYFDNFWLPAIVSSAIFGLYHLNLAQGIFAFLFGMLLCAVYDKLKNLWAPVIIHAGGNLISVVLVYSGISYISPTLYLVLMIVCLAAAWALYYFCIRPLKIESSR